MKIEHVAYWVQNLEVMKSFYEKYFDVQVSPKYHNPSKNFTSYFLSFPAESTRIELMHRPELDELLRAAPIALGLTHLAIALSSRAEVDQKTETFRRDGFKIIGAPRVTGDGYYESIIADPEGNWIELVA